MNEALNFQSIIMRLQDFWTHQGCLIWQPYYSQVGAGTYNPATFLRALGPEPWRVGYVEPSIRPDDGRYGENPNRMQMHYQFQVILKPDPGNPQDIYLRSLQEIGVDPLRHDIRFVEDKWESPALGAWGLGWEVWLDGQEITQFTYFQQAGGLQLDPVSVEITYGLERIAMALQRVNSFVDIQWSPFMTDGDVNLQAEQEHSKYYFESADIDRVRQMYDLFELEAYACLDDGLVLPAYDYVLKCSHTFNVLDTRGAIGVTERQAYFGRMRSLSRKVAEAYLDQRQSLGYPWLQENKNGPATVANEKIDLSLNTSSEAADQPSQFLFEIGTEELPVADLDSALRQLEQSVPDLFERLRLSHGVIKISGTPRRLVISVEDLAGRQSDQEQVVKGPPADRAFDSSGEPTQAAIGFARGKGVAVTDLEIREMDGGRYVVAVVQTEGRRTVDVLAEALPELVASLTFDKPMRWNTSNVFFSRPIRWFLALFGKHSIPFEYAGVRSDLLTHGLRFHSEESIRMDTPVDYFKSLKAQGIILDVDERKQEIRDQIEVLASSVGGLIREDEALLQEVTNLVEYPTALIGSFDPAYLELPREVLISVMKKHQRYFPIEVETSLPTGETGYDLLPHFIAVRNGGDQHIDMVKAGNEHVIRARFADAAYFVREDMRHTIDSYLPKLSTLTFQVDLGSMLDKTHRIEALSKDLSRWLSLDREEIEMVERVAHLAKADLASQMVVEMTSLQGIMGYYYALNSGEPKGIAEGIKEHYLPRYMGDDLPNGRAGLVVGLADRLDSLVGLFSVGMAPTGNRDPFAQRRTALGLVQILVEKDIKFDLTRAITTAASNLPVESNQDAQSAVYTFIVNRLRNILLDAGQPYDIVDAVLGAQGNNPAGAVRAVRQLRSWVARSDWNEILPAYSRCVRITRDIDEPHLVNADSLVEHDELALYEALVAAEKRERHPHSVDDFLNAFLPMIPAINRFFDQVLVMTDDERLRNNRLGLLQRISALADQVADMSRLEGF